ncbi:MAG: Gfo/Idh/MocA family protein [Bryobacteraceae bacterium]
MDRRQFFFTAGTALAASPNDTVRVACVGVRGQGQAHIAAYAKMPNVRIAAICDLDPTVLKTRIADAERQAGYRPAAFTDFRKLLEDKSIDAVSIATPNHWHALQTIWACQAGKDVYVEKPCAHNMFEARQMLAAARKYSRIVQHGSNLRSSDAMRQAAAHVREGLLGEVYLSRGLCFKWRDTIGRAPEENPPAGVNYDMWLGPAPKRPFTRNRFHYNFHWFWDYGNGDLGNQGIHQLDVARWLLGVRYPAKISAIGGHYMFDDDQETPNTLTACFEFDSKKIMVFEVRHWISNAEAEIQSIADPMSGPAAGSRISTGNIVYGSKGYLSSANGYKTWMGKDQQPGPAWNGAPDKGNNWANFIAAVRSRKTSDLNAPLEEAVPSAALIHLANISYRLGRTLYFDAETWSCKGDAEATRMFTRPYRPPYVVPEKI